MTDARRGSRARHAQTGEGDGLPLWAAVADGLIGRTVDSAVAILIAAEVLILFAGVVARYVLRSPLVWSDELASILFLWLAMLGAVVALRRSEHMRMTTFVLMVPPVARSFVQSVGLSVSFVFLVLLLLPSIDYAHEEIFITTPALEVSNVWRAAALPTGIICMMVSSAFQFIRLRNAAPVVMALLLVIAIIVGFKLAEPLWRGLGNLNLLIFFVVIVAALVFAGVAIAFAFGLATFGYLALTTHVPMVVVIGRMDEGMSHLILLSVPLFVFLGLLIETTGMARAMVAFLASLLGQIRGGLSYVLVGAMYLVSGISGAKAADMAAVAPVLFPEMQKRGAKPGDLVALLSATGAQTETIPPSLVLITIGSVTGVSIAALFTGGLLPGAVLAVTLCMVVWFRYRRDDLSHVRRPSAAEIARAFIIALPALALPFVIRAAVVEGIATATEVSTIGIVYSLVVGAVVYRNLDPRRLPRMLIDTASLSGAILLIIGAATGMAWALTQSGFSRQLASAMAALPGGAPMFLAVSVLAFIVLGSVLEGIPAIVLFGPLLFPIARQMGIHEVHYAMVVILAMGIGLFAPPFGVGYYVACAIGRVNPDDGMRAIWGYLVALVAGLVLVAAVPWFSIGFL